jgi:hypothetical protein
MFRNLPMEPGERQVYRRRRMTAATRAAQALEPRDEIELMLAVQAVTAHYRAAAHWRASMNSELSEAEALRQASAAASATRVFDSMLRAIERRQARAMAEHPQSRDWEAIGAVDNVEAMGILVATHGAEGTDAALEPIIWPGEAIRATQGRIAGIGLQESGPGIAGVNPDGSITVPENATEEQQTYIGRRLAQTIANEKTARPGPRTLVIKPIQPGDRVP